jgi:uncharacterized protein
VAVAAAGAAAAASGRVAEGAPEGALPDLALKGIEEFNRGEFYECHEYLEEAWMQEPGRVRFLYQGILQVGVGFYHLQNGNWRGATGLLRNGAVRLERCLRELELLGRERIEEFDRTGVPKVEWAE